MVIETRGDEKAPIILGRPFLSTAKAIIYTDNAKICFNVKGRKEKFTFKNRTLESPVHPQTPYIHQNYDMIKKKKNNWRNKNG